MVERAVRSGWARRGLVSTVVLAGLGAACVPDPVVPTTERIDVSSAGAAGDGPCCYNDGAVTQSADGRYVLFNSLSTNLVAGDTNGAPPPSFAGMDIFVRDRAADTTVRVSVLPGGGQISSFDGLNASVGSPGISPNGRWVVFTVRNPGVDPDRIYRYDLLTGTSSLLRELGPGDPVPAANLVEVSNSGTVVAYTSNGRARVLDTTLRDIEDVGTAAWTPPRLSADGRFVAADGYVHDRVSDTTEPIVDTAAADDAVVAMSDDARFVLFRSNRAGLTPDDTNAVDDLYLKDRATTSFRLVTGGGGAGGIEPTGGWTQQRVPVGAFTVNARYPLAAVSNDGTKVAFATDAVDSLPETAGGDWNTYVRVVATGETDNVTADHSGHARFASWGGDILSGSGTRFIGAGIRSGIAGLWSSPVG